MDGEPVNLHVGFGATVANQRDDLAGIHDAEQRQLKRLHSRTIVVQRRDAVEAEQLRLHAVGRLLHRYNPRRNRRVALVEDDNLRPMVRHVRLLSPAQLSRASYDAPDRVHDGRRGEMPILVTGATGFVPANVVARLVADGRDVVAFHHRPLDPAMAERLRGSGPGMVTFVQGDTRDADLVATVFAAHQPEGVIHMAAMTPLDVDTERHAVRDVVGANIGGTLHVFLAAAEQRARRVVFLSSAAVYAPREDAVPIAENAPLRDDGALYALTKLAGEQLGRWASVALGLDVRAVRLGPAYGPWERPTASRQRMSSVWQAVHEALAGRPLRCNNPALTRDWVHADDVARGLVALLDAPGLRHDVYNLAGAGVTMEDTLAAVAAAIPGTRVEWVADPATANVPVPDGPARGSLATTRLRADVGWTPRYAIEDGVRAYVEWLRA